MGNFIVLVVKLFIDVWKLELHVCNLSRCCHLNNARQLRQCKSIIIH